MKPLINYLLIGALLLAAPRVPAQKPMSKEGYWVIESNVKTPTQSTVYFYNNQHQMVYKEAINHTALDISKPKVRRQLNTVLEQSIVAWKREKGVLLASHMQ